ncbi:MAG: glycosyltransferase family 4 protein [Gammaproteobacteria bacterium]|nr:glycosyltransferase family 4 protein [Gammaproteobacteria bacterium]
MPKIAVVLPPREFFRPADAGAIALTVYDFVKVSRFIDDLIVFGGHADHFYDIKYQYIHTKLHWLFGQNRAYARSCIAEIMRDDHLQLIEVHNRVALALTIKKALPKRQVALHIHNDPHSMAGAKTALEREKLLRSLDMAYCVSHYVRDRLLDGVSDELHARARVVYNAISLSSVETDAPRQPWIVYAGRFIPEKGVLELAQALAHVLPLYPEWKAVFVGARGFGDQAGQSKYEQSIYTELAHVADQIEFRGHVQHEEVMRVFNQALIAVIPSTGAEAFGRTALEAMDAGCAVVTSASGGLKEVAGDAAIIVNPVNQETLTMAMTQLMMNPALRQNCAIKCQQYARDIFSLPVQASYLDQIRAELLVTVEATCSNSVNNDSK